MFILIISWENKIFFWFKSPLFGGYFELKPTRVLMTVPNTSYPAQQ